MTKETEATERGQGGLQEQAVQRRHGAVQDLHSLDAIIPFEAQSQAKQAVNQSKQAANFVSRIARTAQIQPSSSVKRIEQRLTVVPLRKPLRTNAVPGEAPLLPPLPSGQRKRSYAGYIWFALCVLLPTGIAAVYYGFIASNQYVAEFRFTVKDGAISSAAPSVSSLMSLIGTGSSSNSADNYMVADYLTSRQAVDELQSRLKVIDLYSKPEIDWWSRFNRTLPVEDFVKYWQSMVNSRFDVITGIATAEIRAFSAQDALLVANMMVTLSEELVNKVSTRSQNDAVRFAAVEVEKAQERLKAMRARLTAYRDKFGVIDPTTSVAASNSALIQSQRANLAQLETQLATLQSQKLLPNAPAVVGLRTQIQSTKEQLARTETDVGKGNNGAALSKIVGDYEQLSLEVQFAQAMVTSTMQVLEQARANATAQHLYITPYVRPALPDSSVYPRRVLSVFVVAMLAFAFWLIALMIVRSIRERFG